MRINYSLYLILDETYCAPHHMPTFIKELIPHGITCVQLRMKSSSTHLIEETGKAILKIARPHAIPLIINDNISIAKTIDADGVHIGQQDISYSIARRYLGKDKIIGLSIENETQAHHCREYDVDYFGIGPIYPTTSKPNAAPAVGLLQLKKLTSLLTKPTIAIGGITSDNAIGILQSGVQGLAVISAILGAHSPIKATQAFSNLISSFRESYV
jgi:thiamine-phosphate pyrophosphorylase